MILRPVFPPVLPSSFSFLSYQFYLPVLPAISSCQFLLPVLPVLSDPGAGVGSTIDNCSRLAVNSHARLSIRAVHAVIRTMFRPSRWLLHQYHAARHPMGLEAQEPAILTPKYMKFVCRANSTALLTYQSPSFFHNPKTCPQLHGSSAESRSQSPLE